jgi:uncharacterized protein (DUF1778 family)
MSASEVEKGASQTRDVKINIRAQQNQRDLIDRAAKARGKVARSLCLNPHTKKPKKFF